MTKLTIKGNKELTMLRETVEGRMVFEGRLRSDFERQAGATATMRSASLNLEHVDDPHFECDVVGDLSENQRSFVTQMNYRGYPLKMD